MATARQGHAPIAGCEMPPFTYMRNSACEWACFDLVELQLR
jgi:hypothetical protein